MKPGIIYGNAMTAIAGFLLASIHSIRFLYLLQTVVSISIVIGSACVFNNVLDRKIDAKMKRTKSRATVSGSIAPGSALFFASCLGILGFALLGYYTNITTIVIGTIGYLDYILVYAYYKRKSPVGTLVGSISGATPITAGYCAVTGHLNLAAALLFFILVIWQMPHFYAIAIGRMEDYKDAAVPVLPVKKGLRRTKLSMLCYIALFVVLSILLTTFRYAGYLYASVMIVSGVYWYWITLQGLSTKDNKAWARSIFKFSLLIICIFSVMVSFGDRLI
jgi:heme o synthase